MNTSNEIMEEIESYGKVEEEFIEDLSDEELAEIEGKEYENFEEFNGRYKGGELEY